MEGESTLMSKLSSCSNLIQKIASSSSEEEEGIKGHTLVLLDGLGSGTDPESGSALAQSILDTTSYFFEWDSNSK